MGSINNSEVLTLFTGLAIAAAIGFLIGIEREYAGRDQMKPSEFFAGIRTFPIISTLGYLLMLLGQEVSMWIYGIGMLGVLAIIVVGYLNETKRGDSGSTTEFTAVLTFALGGVVYLHYYELAVATAVLITFLLALKSSLHKMVAKLTHEEIMAILQFIVITVLILPFLPDKYYGPYDALNPHKIWVVVIILVSINFGLYLIAKFIRPGNSLLLAGFIGGMVSSTALNWYVARQSMKSDGQAIPLALTAIVASSLMFFRMIILIYIFNAALIGWLALPLLFAGTSGMLCSWWMNRRYDPKGLKGELPIQNPLNLKDALKFAVFYSFILILVAFAQAHLGNAGVYLTSAVSGLTDVDAITISLSRLAGREMALAVAATAILIAALTNTVIKYVICIVAGNRAFIRAIAPAYLLLVSSSSLALLFVLIRI